MEDDFTTNIRRGLLYDKIRTINTQMDEATFQAMKAMPIDEWCRSWMIAGINATEDDLAAVHNMLWPKEATK